MPAFGTSLGLSFAALLPAGAVDGPIAAPVRTVLAKCLLANPAAAPLQFRLQRVELEPGRTLSAPEEESMLYVLPGGPLAVVAGGTRTQVAPGDALRLAGGSAAKLEAGDSRMASFLRIGLGSPGAPFPGGTGITELFRTTDPLPGLGAGPLTFDLTRVTFPPHMPANPPHHRTGNALYFVLWGAGEFTSQGKAQPRPPGTCHFEPSGMVHQWANPGDEPLVLLVANVTREGTPALAFEN